MFCFIDNNTYQLEDGTLFLGNANNIVIFGKDVFVFFITRTGGNVEVDLNMTWMSKQTLVAAALHNTLVWLELYIAATGSTPGFHGALPGQGYLSDQLPGL